MRVLTAVCSNRGVQPQTMQCLMNLKGDIDFIVPSQGYTIAENRNYSAVQAVNGKYDYLLFIDDDMTFEPDLLENLMKNDKDIVGVAFHPRCDDMKVMHETHKDNLKDNKPFKTDAVGTGIMLIKTPIFLNIKRPWFAFEVYDNGACKLGEDWYFCREANRAGFEVWCDPTVKVGHLGDSLI